MKVILVDDEKSMLIIMKKMLSKIPDIELIGSFQSTKEAYQFLKNNSADIAFVDINMPEENGFDFARRILSEFIGLAVTFLTCHKEYALEAFDVNAFDYIVKPISRERLEISIQRVRQRNITSRSVIEDKNSIQMSVYCMGTMEVRCADGNTIRFSSSKSQELLAYLLLNRRKSVSKWRILEDIFPGMPLQNAETYLNTTVYKLRKALEQSGMKSVLISGNESYKIETKNMYIDFIDFENRLIHSRHFENNNLDEELKSESLYAGELFGEKDYFWAMPEKEKFSIMYSDFAKKLIAYLMERNLLVESLYILKKLEYINEMDEEVHCCLMKVYTAQKDKVSLQRQYKRYSNILRNEFGSTPNKATSDLYHILKKSLN